LASLSTTHHSGLAQNKIKPKKPMKHISSSSSISTSFHNIVPHSVLSIGTMAKSNKRKTPTKSPKKSPKAKEDKMQEDSPKKQAPPPKDPQPVSSDSEQDEWTTATPTKDTHTTTSPLKDGIKQPSFSEDEQKVKPSQGISRLFAPYRSLGIVSNGPFHLIPHQNSSSAMAAIAIGERFHLLQCDKLHPVLVSQAVPGTGGPQQISHLLSDATLSVSLVAHGPKSAPRHVTLYKRTQPIGSERVCPSKEWTICDLLHLGRIQVKMSGEKEDKQENAVLVAAILTKGKPISSQDGVPVVGDDDDDDSDDSDNDSSSDDDECRGQVVLLVATRTSLSIHKRIELSKVPTFCPRIAVHPSTYVNKILLGGSSSSSNNKDGNNDALVLLNVKTGKVIHVFKCLPASSSSGKSEITALEQSPAVDTIAVGTSQGLVHLINTRHDRLLFSLRHKSRDGNPVQITTMSFRTDGSALQYGIAPMAVGRSDGTISIWDLTPPQDDDHDNEGGGGNAPVGRTLLTEMEKIHSPGGVAKLQYLPQEPLLISTGTQSNAVYMHIFDNPDHSGRLLRHRRGHTSPPKHIRYLHPGAGAGGGVLVNSADGTNAAACQILSSGGADRTLRLFSTVRTVLDKEYSQGQGLEKRAKDLGLDSKAELLLPPVMAMTTSESRSRDWGDLVTIHKDHAFAYVWSSKRGAQSGPVLRQNGWNVSAMKKPPPETTHATSVAISTCGNYALVGTKGGTIFKYNVQSGNARGSYPAVDKEKESWKRRDAGDIRRTVKVLEKKMKISNRAANIDKRDQDAIEQSKMDEQLTAKLKLASHTGYAVTGIAVDSVNKTVISVGADAKLIMWNFATHAPHQKSPFKLPAAATKLCHVRDSDLAAVALADYSALLFDCSNLTIVRRFGIGNKSVCHTGPISDLGFSPDGRTLYTSSLDGTVRVWDVPTNSCVDWLGFNTPPTSLTISPTGEFLATTHTGKLGISLWSDRSFYQTVHVDGAQPLSAPARMDDPVPIAEVESNEEDRGARVNRALAPSTKTAVDEEEDESAKGPATAKEEGLITLSGLPPAHWKNLFHLELVKLRNKPKEAPKKPPSAPFFLQWRGGENLGGEPSKPIEDEQNDQANDKEVWDAVWSDDDDENPDTIPGNPPLDQTAAKRGRDTEGNDDARTKKQKLQKVSHYRSHMAALLQECSSKAKPASQNRFQAVTDHIATLGPSAIDVSLSNLCSGMHDLEEGLPLLHLASSWLLEACQSRERYEAVNAYLHRFLHLHANVIAGIDASNKRESLDDDEDEEVVEEQRRQKELQTSQREELLECVASLRKAQKESSEALEGKMQNTLCLLRHFSRMV
jgi:U3 small nucleolar RNA-associated protein 21